MVKKPKLPRKISLSSLSKMNGKQLDSLRKKLVDNRSRLWRWGFTGNKLSSKSYIKHKVRVDLLIDDVEKSIISFWKGPRGYRARMKKIGRKK